jgi:hypothetical protein
MHALLIFGFLCMNILLHIFMECVGISSCIHAREKRFYRPNLGSKKTDVCQRGFILSQHRRRPPMPALTLIAV